MKLFCCHTPAHEILFSDYFLPSVPAGFAIASTKLEIAGEGDFLSPEFLRCIRQKMDLILSSLRENLGQVIVWSDVDIQFFELRPSLLLEQLGNCDIAFQKEGRTGNDVNTGFFVCRCNAAATDFFTRVRIQLEQNSAQNEQMVINHLLQTGMPRLCWTYLPFSYYARTHGWPPQRDLALYHANATMGSKGVEQKIIQFRELAFLRRSPIAGLILTSIKYAPKRIRRFICARK